MQLTPVRRRIVERATRLFYREGYGVAGILESIARAGVAKTSLCRHSLPESSPNESSRISPQVLKDQHRQDWPTREARQPVPVVVAPSFWLPSCTQTLFMQVYLYF